MACTRETAHKSIGASLPPREAPPPEVVIISDDDEEEPMMVEEVPMEEDTVLIEDITGHEEDYDDGTVEPTPASPTPAPAAPASPTPSSPTPAPAAPAVTGEQEMVPADEEEPAEEPGWTRTYIYKHASHTAYHHKLLNDMLQEYYANLNTGIQYYCVEYTRPTEATY
jgi:hypothetical protein